VLPFIGVAFYRRCVMIIYEVFPMTKLSVNVNKVALLRNTRTIGIPSVVKAARICIEAGAHGITVHPRPDQRHIRPEDVHDLAELLKDYPSVEYNIEGNPFEGDFMALVAEVRPDQATLVPDTPDAFTSDQGWDLAKDGGRLTPIVRDLKKMGARVSLFMDPEPESTIGATDVGADRIELYTESYASAFEAGDSSTAFEQFSATAVEARRHGLGVNAGHDLNLDNLPTFCTIPEILEVSIGHALIGDALEMGLDATVKAYLAALGY
jgi:pyridoxine 5-phosphate synthase